MRVLDLLARPQLGLSVVWGEGAMLEREVTGSYILDLPEPGKFLSPGDLVLSAALWHTGEESARTFISGLASADVAVLVVGRIVLGEIPEYFARECREHGIVLLTISPEVSFKSVMQFVETTLASEGGESTPRGAAVTARMLDGLASGAGLQSALRLLFDEFRVASWLIGPGSDIVAAVGPAPSPDAVAAAWTAVVGRSDSDAVTVDAGGRSVTVWPIEGEQSDAVGYLVSDGDPSVWPLDLARVLATARVVARVELGLAANGRRSSDAQASDFVTGLVSDSLSPGEASARMRLLGMDPLDPVTVVAASVDDPDYPALAVLEGVRAMVADAGTVGISATLEGEAIVFLSGAEVTPEAILAAAESPARRVRAMLGSRHLRIGVSERTLSLSQVSDAVSVARSRMRSLTSAEPIAWASRSTPGSFEGLLEMVPDRVLAAFGHGLLDPLLEYDARHGSDLVETLRVFLDSGAAWQHAATQLHVHVNTLRYRVGRIEALTSRDLASMRDRVDLFLALAALRRS
jgi:hypothetical protein